MDIYYSIRELEHLSEIKAHTIRVWEQRYGIIKPMRTDTNIRYYTSKDLKRLLNIALLNRYGFKISKIAKMSQEEVNTAILQLMEENPSNTFHLNALTQAVIEMDEMLFEDTMNTAISEDGFEQTMIEVVYPFLEKIGILWQSGSINPAQEHFMSNLIRQKLIVGIDQLQISTLKDNPKYLLFMPEGELHELGLLFAHYLLKARGHKVTYLGASVPLEDVTEVTKIKKTNTVFCLMTSHPIKRKLSAFIEQLSKNLPNSQIILSGYLASRIGFELPSNVKILHKVTDLIDIKNDKPLSDSLSQS